jgi:hypothetical protein
MRTFDRATYYASRQAWDDGDFSEEWKDTRHQAAMRGIIFPPNGTKWDSWEGDSPSQRAILIRAIRETPNLLRQCIERASDWNGVIGLLTSRRDELREDGYLWDTEDDREREDRPSHREAVTTLANILERIATSRGIEA